MRRILILDDRPINRQFLTTLLAYNGFETREAADGVEGLARAREWRPDVAIVDIAMPRMDGIEFTRRVRADGELAQMPIIFYTASYDELDARRLARQCGVAHVLMKPADPETILATIERALGERAPRVAQTGDAERLQAAAMHATALIDFQLEIAGQKNAKDILRTLARAARKVIASEHSIVTVDDMTITGCSDNACSAPQRMGIPLETASRRYGWLLLMKSEGAYTADDERIALTMGAQAATTYENTLLYDEIRREAELLTATIEASGDAILVVDNNSRFVTFNRRLAEIWQLPEEILLSRNANASLANSLTLVNDADAFREFVDDARRGEEVSGTFELRDGRRIECHAAPRFVDGELIGRVWTFRDVTERVRAEEALRASEEKFRSLIANIPDVTWTADAAGNIVFVSPNAEVVWGYTPEEVLGDAIWRRSVHPDALPQVHAAYAALFTERKPFEAEYRMRRKDGRWIWMRSSSRGIYERDGAFYADGVASDITAIKETEEELRRVARERELLLESTGEGIFAIEVDGRCTMANRVAASLLGRGLNDLVGYPIDELIHPHHGGECPIFSPFTDPQPVHVTDDAFIRSDGTSFPVEYSSSPIIDAGFVRGAVVTFSDVTERRRLERRLEEMNRIDSLGRMAANIAHEFNNVLMGIQPFAELVRRNPDPAVQKAATQILNSVARGKTITQDISRMTRQPEPSMQPVDVAEWIEQVASEIRALVGAGIHVELALPEPGTVFAPFDPVQIHQVLTNLAVNAQHAMQGNGALRISAGRAEKAVRISVADTGSGIAPQTLPLIFEPLFTTKRSGTGLGLAVAQQLVVRNGGTISVESTVGEGTTFHIDFPEITAEWRTKL